MLLLSVITTLSLSYQIGIITETYAAAEVQHANNIIEQQEQQKASISTKKITMILEDTEIEIAPNEKIKSWAFNGTVPGPTVRLT
jgi:hypothetical protein